MKRIGKIALLTLSILGLSFVLTLATSHKVRAAVTAMVLVTNTATNPVINQDVDSPGRSPYYQTEACYNASENQCSALFPAVPANTRLVVQYINSSVDTPTALISAEFDVGGTIFMPILHTLQGNDSGGNKIYVASQPMLYYWEAGQQPYLVMNAQAGGFQFMSGQVTLTGYLVNLTE